MEDGIKISELNSTTSMTDSDLIPIVQSNETKIITKEDFQSNIQPVVLYNNSSGSNSTITLSDDVNNYSYIEIFYKSNDDYVSSKKIIACDCNTDLVSYQPNRSGDPETYIKFRVISIGGNTITTRQDSSGYFIKEVMLHTTYQQYANNYIYITRVLGYK